MAKELSKELKEDRKRDIVELKEKGMSFTEIAVEMEKKYGCSMSRQQVYGLYMRASKNPQLKGLSEFDKIVIQLYIRLYNASQVYRELYRLREEGSIRFDNARYSYGYVSRLIEDNREVIQEEARKLEKYLESYDYTKVSIEHVRNNSKLYGVAVSDKILQSAMENSLRTAMVEFMNECMDEANTLNQYIAGDVDIVKNVRTSFVKEKLADKG